MSLPLFVDSLPSASKEAAAPYLALGAFSEILVSATHAGTLVAVVSTVQGRRAGVASVLLVAAVTLTWRVREPWQSPSWAVGQVQGAKVPASSLRSKVLPTSSEEKGKLAELLFTVSESMVLCSGVVSVGGGPEPVVMSTLCRR